MYSFDRKALISFAANLIISALVVIRVAEASHNDIMLDLFSTRSATNFSLKHHLHDNIYFVSKSGTNSNAVVPSSIASGQVAATPETGIIHYMS